MFYLYHSDQWLLRDGVGCVRRQWSISSSHLGQQHTVYCGLSLYPAVSGQLSSGRGERGRGVQANQRGHYSSSNFNTHTSMCDSFRQHVCNGNVPSTWRSQLAVTNTLCTASPKINLNAYAIRTSVSKLLLAFTLMALATCTLLATHEIFDLECWRLNKCSF